MVLYIEQLGKNDGITIEVFYVTNQAIHQKNNDLDEHVTSKCEDFAPNTCGNNHNLYRNYPTMIQGKAHAILNCGKDTKCLSAFK